MPKLSDEAMAELRATLDRRRAARNKKPKDEPQVDREARANVLAYAIFQLVPGSGYQLVFKDADLEVVKRKWEELGGRQSRALIYIEGRTPSRGKDATGFVIMDAGEY